MNSPCELERCPPVGELAHKEGYCYCYKCTCGNHICPSTFASSPPSVKFTRTSYRKDFAFRASEPPRPFIRTGQLTHSKNPMKFDQLYREEDLPSSLGVQSFYEERKSLRVRFTSTSTYKDNFNRWKCHPFIRVSGNYEFTPSELKMQSQTTYNTDFQNKSDSPSSKQAPSNSALQQNTQIGVSNFSLLQTTQRAFFKPVKTKFQLPVKRKKSILLAMASPRMHFSSMYGQNYKDCIPPQQILTQRQLKKLSIS